MIDICDSEAIIKVYRYLSQKCDAIDEFIANHAYYFGSSNSEYGALEVCNSILDLMSRKNQLINLKVIVDNAISHLDEKDKQILYVKKFYSLSIDELCGVLELKTRTAFRRIERAFENLTDELNKSKYVEKLKNIIDSEIWIKNIREQFRERHISFAKTSSYC